VTRICDRLKVRAFVLRLGVLLAWSVGGFVSRWGGESVKAVGQPARPCIPFRDTGKSPY
jgi:hypothetical protein